MRIGFAKVDITPRVGVELAGFGPYRLRRSVGVRDRLWARAMAAEQDGRRVVLVSCDLLGVSRDIARQAREAAAEQASVAPEAVMVHCTHTHSGPNAGGYIGWGAPDPPYLEILPWRIAQAAVQALEALRPARLFHAEVPCEGIGLNREYDVDKPPLEEVLDEDWRPAKPELTDTTCHVLRVESDGRTTGFATYFGCHPVVCCAESRFIHGDYCGVATNLLEREHPGAVGLFLQGANGDVNSCVVHKPETESLLALDVIASRYARAARQGLAEAAPLEADAVAAHSQEAHFSRKPWKAPEVQALLEEKEQVLRAPGADDADRGVRMATVEAVALRRLLAAMERGESLAPPTELHGLRFGPLLLLASPLETFQAIKNDVKARTGEPLALVLSTTNDSQGYAPDRTKAEAGGYAADIVPMILGFLPYAAVHDELADGLTGLAELLWTA